MDGVPCPPPIWLNCCWLAYEWGRSWNRVGRHWIMFDTIKELICNLNRDIRWPNRKMPRENCWRSNAPCLSAKVGLSIRPRDRKWVSLYINVLLCDKLSHYYIVVWLRFTGSDGLELGYYWTAYVGGHEDRSANTTDPNEQLQTLRSLRAYKAGALEWIPVFYILAEGSPDLSTKTI